MIRGGDGVECWMLEHDQCLPLFGKFLGEEDGWVILEDEDKTHHVNTASGVVMSVKVRPVPPDGENG